MTWRQRLLAWLRVPPEPTPPAGDEHVTIVRAAPNYFRYRLAVWGLRQIGAIVGFVWYFLAVEPQIPYVGPETIDLGWLTITKETGLTILRVFEIGGIATFVVQAIGSAAILRLDYEQRWYLVSDRSLRIREGLVRLHEKTMTFANVQNVSIRQNPLQRWLGIADVEIRTAGGGASGKDEIEARSHQLHIGAVRGVSDPEHIRDVIRERLKRHRDTGLGDPDSLHAQPTPAAPAPTAPELATLARALHQEARALRQALTPPVSP